MMIASRWLLLLFIPTIILSTQITTAHLQTTGISFHPRLQENCISIIEQLTEEPKWLNQIKDPVINNEQELQKRIDLYRLAYECLTVGDETWSEELKSAIIYLEYFLIFTSGYDTPEGASYLKLVDLETTNDPAVLKLRDYSGLKSPEGYVFVRFYRSRYAMPATLQRLFSEDTAGLTLLTRYIAILEENPLTFEQQALQSQTLPQTISHELVHAYVNTSLGLNAIIDMPRWYAEGIAIYLSNSGEDHVVVGPDLTINSTSPQDYRAFRDNFKFLEIQLGEENLLEVIRQSVEGNDPSIIYHNLGYVSYEDFINNANKYWARRFNIVAAGLGLVIIITVLFVLRAMPDVRCRRCKYTGKKEDFASGYCPNCFYPYHGK